MLTWTKGERANLKVYEMACAALKFRRDHAMITDDIYLAELRRVHGIYSARAEAEHYGENTFENGRLAL